MDKRRQSILKQDGRIPLQETVIPDFPEEDTATVTITKSRRVSFGANFVKEFIVGSAVSTQFFSEYEQAVSSSDSSNPNSSRSGILDRSTFVGEVDAPNLYVNPNNHDEFGPVKKKFCSEKTKTYNEINDRENENVWDFNVCNKSNIFSEKNSSFSNKPEPLRNSIKCHKKVSPLKDSVMMGKHLQNKRNESELNSSKLNETKTKVGKFSSTIFFSADSPTADVEFTEGCISLAKSIFDKKKKDMTVYIKGTPKDSNAEVKRDGNSTVIFDGDDSDVGMKLTKCMDDSESENDMSTRNFTNYFPIPPRENDSTEEFNESHENLENIPFHMYSLNDMLGQGNDSQEDAEMEKSLFFPERSLTEMLRSDPLKTTITDVLPMDTDNTEECDMEISSSDILKTSIIDECKPDEKNESIPADSLYIPPCADVEDEECPSPVFSKVTVGDDLSLTSEDTAEILDPLKMSVYNDLSLSGNGESDLDLSNCGPLKLSECTPAIAREDPLNSSSTNSADVPLQVSSECASDDKDPQVMNSSLSEDNEKRISFSNTEVLEDCPDMTVDSKISETVTHTANAPELPLSDSTFMSKQPEVVDAVTVPETVRSPFLKADTEQILVSSNVKVFTCQESAVDKELSFNAGDTFVVESTKGNEAEECTKNPDPAPVADDVNPEMDLTVSQKDADGLSMTVDSITESEMVTHSADAREVSASGEMFECEMNTSNVSKEEAISPEVAATSGVVIPEHDVSAGSDNSKTSLIDDLPLMKEEKMDVSMNGAAKLSEEEEPVLQLSSSDVFRVSMCESNPPTELKDEEEMLHGETCLQETQLCENTLLSQTITEDDDPTSLGDKKIIGLLTEHSKEANCCWKIDSINSIDNRNFWSFSFAILKRTAVMKFKLSPPKDKSILSFSAVLDGTMELLESTEYELKKDRLGIDFAFGKLKNHFKSVIGGLDDVHRMPLFLDSMNLIVRKMNGILHQVIKILKDYPGSQLKESLLSFRIYSFPLLFSYLITVDVSDPFKLSENCVSVKKQFGDLKVNSVKSIFKDCLRNEEVLVKFVRTLTEYVVDMERETGSITKRSHIPLIR